MTDHIARSDRAKHKRTRAEILAPDVARLAAEGMGRNEIVKVLGTSQGTVTRAAEIAGVSFSRSPQLAEAAAIASLNAKQLRTELELQLLRAGLLAAQRLATGNFEDARDLIVIAGVAHDKSVNQERLTLQTGKAPADESDMARYFEHILGGGKADDEPRKYVYPKDDE